MLLLHTTTFGAAVAARLAGDPGVTAVHLPPHPSEVAWKDLPSDQHVALVAARPLAPWGEALEAAWWEQGRTLTCCELTDMSLLLGPTVRRGKSACLDCAQRRRTSMLRDYQALEEQRCYLDGFAKGYLVEIPGFTPSLAAMAAAHLRSAFRDEGELGLIREFDLGEGSLRACSLIGLHGCPRCGRQERPRERFVERLFPILQEVVQ